MPQHPHLHLSLLKIIHSYNFIQSNLTTHYANDLVFRNKTATFVKLRKLCIYIQIKDD